MTDPDFPCERKVEVQGTGELRALLEESKAVRLAGTCSSQHRLPPPEDPVTLVSLRRMNRILRLEAEDLTCSLEAGVSRQDLDAELLPEGLQLPCAGQGTLGGIFATDAHGPLAPAAHSPRSLLLGFEGMLAEGLAFKSGGKVVKNVAGFDLQKLFVGSRGQLFAVTTLHLKLRRKPERAYFFEGAELAQGEALDLFKRLRLLQTPPSCLAMDRGKGKYRVFGQFEGPGKLLEILLREHGLDTTEESPPLQLGAGAGGDTEVLQCMLRPSQLPGLLKKLPDDAGFLTVGNRCELSMQPEQADLMLQTLAALAIRAELVGGEADRRGLSTARSSGAEGLARGLKKALDPRGVLQ